MKKYEATFIDPLDKDPIKITCVGDVYSQALMQAERFLEIEQDINPKKLF